MNKKTNGRPKAAAKKLHSNVNNNALSILLARLEDVHQTGPDTFVARCPAHNDKSPSLAIRETADGTILMHCFAGCSVQEICDAIGIEVSDLFPPREHLGHPERRTFAAMDALRAISFEALVVVAAASSMLTGEPLSSVDRDRLHLALGRISSAVSAVSPMMRKGHIHG